MKLTLNVDDSDLHRALDRLKSSRRSRAQKEALQAGAFIVEAGAKRRAPVRTGFLRSSIRAQEASEREVQITVGAEYAKFVEFGTSRQAPRPYLRPTLNEERSDITEAMRRILRDWLARQAR